MTERKLSDDIVRQIDTTARRLDYAYQCGGNQVAAIRAFLTHAALKAMEDYREEEEAA